MATRLTARQAMRESVQLADTPAYYVVCFLLDEEVCCIPHRMIVDTTTAIGEMCKVKWTDGEIYETSVLPQN